MNKKKKKPHPKLLLFFLMHMSVRSSYFSFPILTEQQSVATKSEKFKLEIDILKLEIFGLEMVRLEMSDLNGSCRPPYFRN